MTVSPTARLEVAALDEVDALLCGPRPEHTALSPAGAELLAALSDGGAPQWLLATAYLSAAHGDRFLHLLLDSLWFTGPMPG